MFCRWGKVVDVYVPSRRDRYGRRFGFVRFVKGGDLFDLERRLQHIWIGTYKLRVRLSVSKQEVKEEEATKEGSWRMTKNKSFSNKAVPEVTYAAAVTGRGPTRKQTWQPKKVDLTRSSGDDGVQWKGLSHVVLEEDMEWLKNCYIGQVHSPDVVFQLQEKVFAEGLYSVKVTPMGGDLVLIQVEEGEDFLQLVKDYEDAFEKWFADLCLWSPPEVPKHCHVWVRCQGIPLHAWDMSFFKKFVTLFGLFVMLDDRTDNKSRLDLARILIQTSSLEVINCLIKVKINDLIFSIRVVEEPFSDSYMTFFEKQPPRRSSSSSSSGEDSLSLLGRISLDSFGIVEEAEFEI